MDSYVGYPASADTWNADNSPSLWSAVNCLDLCFDLRPPAAVATCRACGLLTTGLLSQRRVWLACYLLPNWGNSVYLPSLDIPYASVGYSCTTVYCLVLRLFFLVHLICFLSSFHQRREHTILVYLLPPVYLGTFPLWLGVVREHQKSFAPASGGNKSGSR